MSSSDQEQLVQAMRQAFARRCGTATDAHGIADALVGTLREISARLSPMFGERGVDVLLGRALHLTGAKLPWLELPKQGAEVGTPLAALKLHLVTGDRNKVSEASELLLVTFTELLASLIGPTLTGRLLATVGLTPQSESSS